MPGEVVSADVIAITGHRVYPDPANLYRGLDGLKAREYLFGGARGVDSDGLKYMARTQPGSIRTVVVPNRLIDQPLVTQPITKTYATRVIELGNTGANRYQLRNQYIVDHSDRLRAFYDFRGRGGTLNTIDYARSQGKSFDVYPLNDFDKNTIMSMNEKDFNLWVTKMRGMKVRLSAVKSIITSYIQQAGQTKLGYWFPEIIPGQNLEKIW